MENSKSKRSLTLVLVAVVMLMMVFLLQGCAGNNEDTVAATAPVEEVTPAPQAATESPAIAEAPAATEEPSATEEPVAAPEPTVVPTAEPAETTLTAESATSTATATATAAAGYGGYFNGHNCYHHICISCQNPVCFGSGHYSCATTGCAYYGWYLCGGHPRNADGTPAHSVAAADTTTTTPGNSDVDNGAPTDPVPDNADRSET